MWNIETNIEILELEAVPNANTVKSEIIRMIENKERTQPQVTIKLKKFKKLSIKKKNQKHAAPFIVNGIPTSI